MPPEAAVADDRGDKSGEESSVLLELKGLTKRFPGVTALENVDFTLRSGEVHVLFGENGAGKSTLINIVAGTYPADEGALRYRGHQIEHLTPHKARQIGISPVFQEFSLAPDLSVQENLLLGREVSRFGILKKRDMRDKADAVLKDLGFEVDARTLVKDLTRAEQQMTEIAKALLQNVGLLILDEPTASLTERETEKLFALIDRFKGEGVGIIYVSHRMSEIRQIADRITVLRDGRKIATLDSEEVVESELVELMSGRKIEALFPKIRHDPGRPLLEVKGLTTAVGLVRDVSFCARAGEVVGIAGLVGCGKSEIARAIFGLEPIESGEVLLEGKAVAKLSPSRMLKDGLCYFPSDRVAEGLSLPRSIRENVVISALDLPAFARFKLLRRQSERDAANDAAKELQIRPADIRRAVTTLSGGNRQKVMLARGLTRDLRIFLFDEPTVGIDVAAKTEIYHFMKSIAEGGGSVVLISSELPEVLNLANRVCVMSGGQIVVELQGEDITEQAVLSNFF